MNKDTHCVVIGAGIIGIACGISLLERGYRVTLYDPEPPGSMTSFGNAGGFGFTEVMPMVGPGVIWRVPKWLLDPCGPLFIRPGHFPALIPWLIRFQKLSKLKQVERISYALRDILQHSMTDTREIIKKVGLQNLFVEDGMITAYKTKQHYLKDQLEWKIKAARGVKIEMLDGLDIKRMEPALKNINFGIYTPEWCNTCDPFKMVTKLADYFLTQGGKIVQSAVKAIQISGDPVQMITTSGGQNVNCDQVIVAAGVWSKHFCKQLGDSVLLESERGYNTTLPNPKVKLNRQITFGEEKFVVTNVGNGLRIGGAAEFSGINAPVNYQRSASLVEIARRYLPNLDDSGGEKWMGQRPSTPDSLPIISPSSHYSNVHYAFGHSHGGLTMAATTGKLIAQLIANEPTAFDLSPFHIKRFQ